jgi:hypothetical protein
MEENMKAIKKEGRRREDEIRKKRIGLERLKKTAFLIWNIYFT